MSASFEKIDYALRPAKHTERRMLSEIFRHLWPFGPLSEYVYVGFGAVAFSDFVLFHKSLGIREMHSIEKTTRDIDRVRANVPFHIKVEGKQCSQVLPNLDWKRAHILWLDYDDKLSPDILLDVATVANNATSGTAFAVSFNCHCAREVDEARSEGNEASAITRFRNRFGRDRVPDSVAEDDLYSWSFADLGRRMILAEIQSALAARNARITSEKRINFTLLCSIEYKDDAKMTTLVGMFWRTGDKEKFDACRFDTVDFLSPVGNRVRIDVPKLTLREIRLLEQQLPHRGTLSLGTIPTKDAVKFVKLYRYLPNFAVLES